MLEADLIEQAGLTQGEAKVYLALLELGSSTTGPITDKSKVAKSFIYTILNNLLEKGLISFIVQNDMKHYQAAEPSRILDYIDVKQEQLEKKRKEIETLLPKLLQVQADASLSHVAMYQGFKGNQTCFERYEEKLKKGEEYLCLGIIANQEEKYHNYWNKHHKDRIKRGVKARMLFNTNTKPEVLKNRNSYFECDSRYMPTDVKTPAWFFIYGDTCAIFLQAPAEFVVEIQNKDIAETFRQYFEDYWRLTKPFTK